MPFEIVSGVGQGMSVLDGGGDRQRGRVSCFCKIQIGFTFLVPAHPGNPRQSPEGGSIKRVCM